MNFDVGDIVTILPFKPCSHIDGIYVNEDMAKEIGKTHVITRIVNYHVFKIDDYDNWNYPDSLLTPATTGLSLMGYYPYNFTPVEAKDGSWFAPKGGYIDYYEVGLYEETYIPLPYDLYGVGVKGERIKVVKFRGQIYLAPDYLPMRGVI